MLSAKKKLLRRLPRAQEASVELRAQSQIQAACLLLPTGRLQPRKATAAGEEEAEGKLEALEPASLAEVAELFQVARAEEPEALF